jgi:hypothetical protein
VARLSRSRGTRIHILPIPKLEVRQALGLCRPSEDVLETTTEPGAAPGGSVPPWADAAEARFIETRCEDSAGAAEEAGGR